MRPSLHAFAILSVIAVFAGAMDRPLAAENKAKDLTSLSLEQLMNVRVTSVSKKPQRVSDTAAAVHVITSDDIRRSGATSIPEILRGVPGLQVARIDSNKWAISSRGFNGQFSNKLLVLMDGRSLYTPVFSGVFWDVQDTFLDDIERIEVIRGPGGTIWGANAVNGVINIITKSAASTQGTVASITGGTHENAIVAGRHGLSLGDDGYLRVFAKHTTRGETELASGADASDEWDMQRAGFRYDVDRPSGAKLMVQGEFYRGEVGQTVAFNTLTAPFTSTFAEDNSLNGQHVLARWSGLDGLTVQGYYDRAVRHDLHASVETNTLDLEVEKRRRFGKRHDVVAGVGYRLNQDSMGSSSQTAFNPDADVNHIVSGFIQDEYAISDSIALTAGTKIEYNTLSGFEFQPSVRARWRIDGDNALWGAVSRAVRTPSRAADAAILNSTVIPGAPPIQARILGSPDARSEELLAFEIGYRARPRPELSLDIAAFYNVYDNLISTEMGTAFLEPLPAPVHIVQPFVFGNTLEGEAFGVEIAGDWRPRSWLRVLGSYTLFELELRREPGGGTAANEAAEKRDPRHQASVTARFDIGRGVEFDATVRAVDRLAERSIKPYVAADLRLSWQPNELLEFSLVGRNLLAGRHFEFTPEFLTVQRTRVDRSVFGTLKIRF